MLRRLLIPVLGVALLLAGPPAWADGFGPRNNYVLLENTTDGAVLERSSVSVVGNDRERITNENVAYAYASCTDCRTVAVAMQAVIITEDARDVRPANAGVAVNEECTRCQTAAFAYQYVVTAQDDDFELEGDARRRVADISRRVRAVTTSGAPFPEIDAQLDALFDELKATVDAALEAEGDDIDDDDRDEDEDEDIEED